VDAKTFTITDQAWTKVSFNVSSATIVAHGDGRLRGHVGGEYTPPLDTTDFFRMGGLYFVQKIPPFKALWLRADTAEPVEAIVYRGNRMTGVVFFGKSPFRVQGPSVVEIEVPYVPQVLDGGRPDTDYTGLAVIDCGGVIQDPAVRTIDGRIAGEAP
jgi:hypothetical protein